MKTYLQAEQAEQAPCEGVVLCVWIPRGSALDSPSRSGLQHVDAKLWRDDEVDGVDLAGVDVRSLRRQIGVVTQEPLIVRDTILGNILLGMRSHDEEAARVAAGLALAAVCVRPTTVLCRGFGQSPLQTILPHGATTLRIM